MEYKSSTISSCYSTTTLKNTSQVCNASKQYYCPANITSTSNTNPKHGHIGTNPGPLFPHPPMFSALQLYHWTKLYGLVLPSVNQTVVAHSSLMRLPGSAANPELPSPYNLSNDDPTAVGPGLPVAPSRDAVPGPLVGNPTHLLSTVKEDTTPKRNRSNSKTPITLQQLAKVKGIKLCHLNICSLVSKLDQIKILLNQGNIDALALSETWLSSNVPDYFLNIDGYKIFRFDRVGIRGGVALYIRDKYPSIQIVLPMQLPSETLAVKLHLSPEHKIGLVVTYKPPLDNSTEYINSLKSCLESMDMNEYIIMGDMNMNWLDKTVSRPIKEMALHQGLEQLIVEPTRVCATCSTILDLIFTNKADKYQAHGVLKLAISDHYLTYAIRKISKVKTGHKTVFCERIPKAKTQNYQNELKNINWTSELVSHNPDQIVSLIHSKLDTIKNKYTKKIMIRQKQHTLPWLNTEILNLLRQKEASMKKYHISKSENDKLIFRDLRNRCTAALRTAKINYYKELLSDAASNPKAIWTVLNSITGKQKISDHQQLNINVDGILLTDPQKVACAFNDFFINSVHNLTVNFNPPLPLECPNSNDGFSFTFRLVTQQHMYDVINSLNKTNSLDIYGLNAKFVLDHLDTFLPVLYHLINLCFETSLFPTQWKLAKIIPILKTDDPTSLSNYRPISILPIMSKILEKLMASQLLEYLETNNFLSEHQFGFRSERSTTTASLYFTEHIRHALDLSQITGAIFIDFKKAFDTVNHQLLLNKLQSFNLDLSAIKMLSSYLSGRNQSVCIGKSKSPQTPCSIGVPQGSILGPLLFILYINDLPSVCQSTQVIMYADDTVVFVSGRDLTSVNNKLTSDLTCLNHWLFENHLTLNIKKTECMYFHSMQKKVDPAVHQSIKINNEPLAIVTSYKYLGVTLDSHLTYKEHVSKLVKQIKQRLFVFQKIRPFLTLSLAKLYLNAVVLSKISYCLPIWGLTTTEIVKPIKQLYNRAHKICVDLPLRSHQCIALERACALSFENYHLFTLLKLYYQIENNLTPKIISSLLPRFPLERRITRSIVNQENPVPKFNNNYGSQSFFYFGAVNWNVVPLVLRDTSSVVAFKRHYKDFLLGGQVCRH